MCWHGDYETLKRAEVERRSGMRRKNVSSRTKTARNGDEASTLRARIANKLAVFSEIRA